MVDIANIDPELEEDLQDLSSAEDFLEYFEVEFDATVVKVNRLHILQKFHNILAEVDAEPSTPEAWRKLYKDALVAAYETFVSSSSLDEKLFKVFKDAAQPKPEPQPGFVSADSLLK